MTTTEIAELAKIKVKEVMDKLEKDPNKKSKKWVYIAGFIDGFTMAREKCQNKLISTCFATGPKPVVVPATCSVGGLSGRRSKLSGLVDVPTTFNQAKHQGRIMDLKRN